VDPWNNYKSVRRTISVVQREALRSLTFAVALFPTVAVAQQECIDLPITTQRAIDLDACRPTPISAGEKDMVLKSLPPEGEVTKLAESERRKLTDLARVLRFHRRDGVYALKVISVPQAWTGLHGRAVLLISLPALQLLDSQELQALVAHEVGHEYLWKEYAAARKDGDLCAYKSSNWLAMQLRYLR
jgi:Zn-dependent protease with chaperone function